jgi:pSer/pThr/pTyr-binding forkhead associated (FHA) protein
MERCSRNAGNKPILNMTIGRHPSNDLVLDSEIIPQLISRYHAEFEVGDNKLVLHPTNRTNMILTTNGTFLNDKRIYAPKVLKLGDIISFGGPKMVVRDGYIHENPFRYKVLQSDSSPMLVEVDPVVVDNAPAMANDNRRRHNPESVNDAEDERPAKRHQTTQTELPVQPLYYGVLAPGRNITQEERWRYIETIGMAMGQRSWDMLPNARVARVVCGVPPPPAP